MDECQNCRCTAKLIDFGTAVVAAVLSRGGAWSHVEDGGTFVKLQLNRVSTSAECLADLKLGVAQVCRQNFIG